MFIIHSYLTANTAIFCISKIILQNINITFYWKHFNFIFYQQIAIW